MSSRTRSGGIPKQARKTLPLFIEGVPEGGGSFVCGKPVILSKAKDLKKRKKRYLTFVRYDTVREPVILNEAKNLNANYWKEMFRYAQHDSNVIQSTTRVPVILSKAKDLKKRKKRYLTFVRYDTVRVLVILSTAKDLKKNTVGKRSFATLNMTTQSANLSF